MGQKIETRLLNGGVNADAAPAMIGKNELMNALNVSPAQPYTQNDGTIQSIPSPVNLTPVNNILAADAGPHTLLGKLEDDESDTLFLFYYHETKSKIIKCVNGSTASIVFREAWVSGGLGWTSDTYISVRKYGELLIFADNVDNRCLNLNRNYALVEPGYVSNLIDQTMLTFIAEPFAIPLYAERITDAGLYSSNVQLESFQFSARIYDEKGFVSVMTPFSETITAVRQTQIEVTPNFGNAILVKFGIDAFGIPRDWKKIDFIVRCLVDKNCYVFRSYIKGNAADDAAVYAHIHGAVTSSLKATYIGKHIEGPLDTKYVGKQYDSVPRKSENIEILDNRVIFANNKLGYTTPPTPPSNLAISTTYTTAKNSTTLPGTVIKKVYLAVIRNKVMPEADFPIYAALVIWLDGKIYALPQEISKLRMKGKDPLIVKDSGAYLPPQIVSRKNLIPIDVFPATYPGYAPAFYSDPFAYMMTLAISVTGPGSNGFGYEISGWCMNYFIAAIIWNLHGIGDNITNPIGDWGATTVAIPGPTEYVGLSRFQMESMGDEIMIVNDAPEAAISGQTQFFLPGSTVKYGIRYYDYAMRSCGRQELGELKVKPYNPFTNELLDKIDFSITGSTTGGSPSWAKYFSITMAKQDLCQDFIMFAPNIIKIARRDKDNIVTVDSDLSNNVLNEMIYGIAVPLDNLAQNKKGYDYADGDFMQLSFAYYTPLGYIGSYDYKAKVIGVVDGHIIIAPPKDSYLNFLASMLSSNYTKISSPRYDAGTSSAISNFPVILNQSRQKICYATIYQQPQTDFEHYEVGKFGLITTSGGGPRPLFFYGPNSTVTLNMSIYGDCYSQNRSSKYGGFVGLSNTNNETTQTSYWITNDGRVAPVDMVGEQTVTNQICWGNTGSINSNFNGLASFDASDYKFVDLNAGPINFILSHLNDGQTNSLLIVCRNNTYVALVGQNVLRNTNGEPAINAASSKFIDNINEIAAKAGTISPRSFAKIDGMVLWADVLNKEIKLYKGGSIIPISSAGVTRVFEKLLTKVYAQALSHKITGGVHPLSGEYYISIPNSAPGARLPLPTASTLPDPLDFYYDMPQTLVFNLGQKKCTNILEHGREFINVNNDVFSWSFENQLMRKEFKGTGNPEYDGLITIPFNEDYATIKAPLALKLDASRPPDETWIVANTNSRFDLLPGTGSIMVANAGKWKYVEGSWLAYILRDRLSVPGISDADWDKCGINGKRLKGKNLMVVFIWKKTLGHFTATSCSLAYQPQ